MRIVFMGTPDFAVRSLQALLQAGHRVTLAVTQPDKPKGRGNKVQFPPVKQAALAAGVPVMQPLTLKDPAVQDAIRAEQPDAIVVAAYGRILPQAVLDIPPLGCINVHGSLLPRYRGAAPVQRAVLNGETQSGITTMLMDKGMDTGAILLTAACPIPPDMTAGELFDKLADIGAQLLLRTLDERQAGRLPGTPQDDALATYAPMLTKQEAELDWALPAQQLHNQVRGLNPAPVARTVMAGLPVKIYRTAAGGPVKGRPGTVASTSPLTVVCGDGTGLELLEVQPDGGKRMPAAAFLCGHPLKAGQILAEKEF